MAPQMSAEQFRELTNEDLMEFIIDCSTLGVWLMIKLPLTSRYGVLRRVSVLVSDSPGRYTPKLSFYVELAVYVAFEQRKTG